MRGLKVVLWTGAGFFLLHFLAVVVPWRSISWFFALYNTDKFRISGTYKIWVPNNICHVWVHRVIFCNGST